MLKAERQQQILARMSETSAVTVNDLAKVFSASPITIRRDLLELGERGLLERTHGGAIATHEVLAEGSARYEMYDYVERHHQQAAQKSSIAESAAQYISDGDCILINSGTTCEALAHALRGHHNLHVITNGLTVAATVSQSHHAHVYVLPGRLDLRKQGTIERPSNDVLTGIRIREAFLGVHAVSAAGIFMRDSDDAAMNKAFVDAASRTTILADHTKLQAFASFRVVTWEPKHRLITDAGADMAIVDSIRDAGAEVIIAG